MTYCEGMGTPLRRYPHAMTVLEAHVGHLECLGPTPERYFAAATVALYLTKETPWSDDAGLLARWDEARTSYLTLVDRTEWCDAARAGLAAGDHRLTYVADFVAPELDLRAFPAPDREPSS
jgi:hypothetical protein